MEIDTVDMDTDEEYEALDDDQCEQIVDAGEVCFIFSCLFIHVFYSKQNVTFGEFD